MNEKRKKIKNIVLVIITIIVILFFVGVWAVPDAMIYLLSLFGVNIITAINVVIFLQDSMEFVLIIIGSIVIIFGVLRLLRYIANYYLSRIYQPKAHQLLQADTRKPILFLRPFKKDNIMIFPLKYMDETHINVESVLASCLNNYGPVIAIGKPNERIQPLGASRLYVDETWKQKVEFLLETSGIVLLMVDFSPGVKWEIETSFSKYRDKLVIIPKLHSTLLNNLIGLIDIIPLVEIDLILAKPLKFIFNRYWLKYGRRNFFYQKIWRKEFSRYNEKELLKINDTVAAITYSEDGYKTYHSQKPDMVSQINAILSAIIEKCDTISFDQSENINLQSLENSLTVCDSDIDIDINRLSLRQQLKLLSTNLDKTAIAKSILKLVLFVMIIWGISFFIRYFS